MANITINLPVDESVPDHAVVHLSSASSDIWRKAFDAYVKWAKQTGPRPDGIPDDTKIPTAAQNSEFQVTGSEIKIKMQPQGNYDAIKEFVDQAIAYANQNSP